MSQAVTATPRESRSSTRGRLETPMPMTATVLFCSEDRYSSNLMEIAPYSSCPQAGFYFVIPAPPRKHSDKWLTHCTTPGPSRQGLLEEEICDILSEKTGKEIPPWTRSFFRSAISPPPSGDRPQSGSLSPSTGPSPARQTCPFAFWRRRSPAVRSCASTCRNTGTARAGPPSASPLSASGS